MRYKIGDKVRVISAEWYHTNSIDVINVEDCFLFNEEMAQFCGKEATIVTVVENKPNIVPTHYYKLDIDNRLYNWQDYMLEDVAETTENKDVKCLILPEGWEVDSIKNDKVILVDKIEGNKVILKAHKKEFPKTWEGCIAILVDNNRLDERTIAGDTPKLYVPKELSKPFKALSKLLVCREVYRAGWSPDWNDTDDKYVIENYNNKPYKECYSNIARILSFQSKEVRDKFLENFRDLIEEAKELI